MFCLTGLCSLEKNKQKPFPPCPQTHRICTHTPRLDPFLIVFENSALVLRPLGPFLMPLGRGWVSLCALSQEHVLTHRCFSRYMCDVARLAISLLKAEAESGSSSQTWRLTVSGKALSSVCQERLDRTVCWERATLQK